ncbi:hypothetical protein PRZ48_014656 [Zasmidium cellare]|uniref:Uncharacterized protein n=1 Tax=Zasmidium cellare TaxID=395010 RepID=A0ABR0DYV2_ZASCE|nr:hypothetical protein PRZ48_014656 [Zasmidium cellare]
MADKSCITSFCKILVISLIVERIMDLLKTFAHPRIERLTGKKWPNFESDWPRVFVMYFVVLIGNVIQHHDLTMRLPGLEFKLLKKSLPNTCEGCIEVMEKDGLRYWPCQRDALVDWYKDAATGKVDLVTLLKIELVAAFLAYCALALVMHLLFIYGWLPRKPSASTAIPQAAQEKVGQVSDTKLEEGVCAKGEDEKARGRSLLR